MTNVLVVGHADADGHVIAEQTRRNLSKIPSFDVDSFVDAKLTRGHHAWRTVDQIQAIGSAELIVFVDLMFAPKSFPEEAAALVGLAKRHAEKRFIIIDHHPLPEARLSEAPNVRTIYRPSVVDCTIGPRTDLMVLAAIDEKQAEDVADRIKDHFETIVCGLRRASAGGSEMQGRNLSALIRFNCWAVIHQLGLDDPQYHRLVRGVRPKGDPRSQVYVDANSLGERLAKLNVNADNVTVGRIIQESSVMAFDVQQDRFLLNLGSDFDRANYPKETRDLEAIVTLLELAAITLTSNPSSTFTKEELLTCARDYTGSDVEIRDSDIDIVLEKASFLKGERGRLRLR